MGVGESSSGRQSQEGKMSDSVPNRNQARPIDLSLGGRARESPHFPPYPRLLLPGFHCMSWESLRSGEHANSINLCSAFRDLSVHALEATTEQPGMQTLAGPQEHDLTGRKVRGGDH